MKCQGSGLPGRIKAMRWRIVFHGVCVRSSARLLDWEEQMLLSRLGKNDKVEISRRVFLTMLLTTLYSGFKAPKLPGPTACKEPHIIFHFVG